jgi:tetratricopeptide (TPR) repeat protein
MKRTILIAILVSIFAVTLCASAIRPAQAWINDYDWIGQSHYEDLYWEYGRDEYWYWEMVFVAGSNATLLVEVYNNYGWPNYPDLNVSAVKVLMDWNMNYSAAECSETVPVAIPAYGYHTFTIEFQVPPTSVASNLHWHRAIIFVEEVNATSGPYEVSSHDMWYLGEEFIVFSTVQKEIITLYDEADMIFDIYGWWPYFSDVEADNLWESGRMYYELAEEFHTYGQFDEALTHYETALDLFYQAIDAEAVYDLWWQDFYDDYERRSYNLSLVIQEAELEVAQSMAEANLTEADAALALANAAMTQAYAWIIFGIGFMIIGLAAVVWAFKHS